MALRLLETGRQTVPRTVLGSAFPDYLVTEGALKQVTGQPVVWALLQALLWGIH